jgi:hypothetical protein
MERQAIIAAKVGHAREVERVLQWLGWSVAVVGTVGIAVFAVLWAVGDLNAEQGIGLILGTALTTVLSGATAYASGVNVGLGAERLDLAARAAQPARKELESGRGREPMGKVLAGITVSADGFVTGCGVQSEGGES